MFSELFAATVQDLSKYMFKTQKMVKCWVLWKKLPESISNNKDILMVSKLHQNQQYPSWLIIYIIEFLRTTQLCLRNKLINYTILYV